MDVNWATLISRQVGFGSDLVQIRLALLRVSIRVWIEVIRFNLVVKLPPCLLLSSFSPFWTVVSALPTVNFLLLLIIELRISEEHTWFGTLITECASHLQQLWSLWQKDLTSHEHIIHNLKGFFKLMLSQHKILSFLFSLFLSPLLVRERNKLRKKDYK